MSRNTTRRAAKKKTTKSSVKPSRKPQDKPQDKPAIQPRQRSDTQVILRHWRGAVPNDRLAHLVKDATRALLRALQMRLAQHDVSLGHWTFLRVLWETDGLTQRELSEQAGVMEPTTFSALQAMERLGYVTRRRMSDDKKKVFVFLTPAGRQLKHRLVPLAVDVNAIAIRGTKAADVATTRQTLLTIIENLATDEATHHGRIPSTREIARRIAANGRTPSRKGRPSPKRKTTAAAPMASRAPRRPAR
ncbi:MAG TPA: MarR family transcriptional regulator [Pseudolabrys sp.]|nr:MarR family transcriptional regulator [Pseudolabrys sp.]